MARKAKIAREKRVERIIEKYYNFDEILKKFNIMSKEKTTRQKIPFMRKSCVKTCILV